MDREVKDKQFLIKTMLSDGETAHDIYNWHIEQIAQAKKDAVVETCDILLDCFSDDWWEDDDDGQLIQGRKEMCYESFVEKCKELKQAQDK